MVIQRTKASRSRVVGMVEVSGNRGSDLGRDGTGAGTGAELQCWPPPAGANGFVHLADTP